MINLAKNVAAFMFLMFAAVVLYYAGSGFIAGVVRGYNAG